MSVQVLHRCDASVTRVSVVEVVQPLAFLPVPETTARVHTHTHTIPLLDMVANESLRGFSVS